MIFKSHQCVFANGELLLSPFREWGDPSFEETSVHFTQRCIMLSLDESSNFAYVFHSKGCDSFLYPTRMKFRKVYGNYHSLSVRLFVQIRPWCVTSFCFDIGITYLAHGCYTMRHPRLQYDLYL